MGRNSVQTAGEQLGQEIGTDETDREPGHNEAKALARHQPQDIARLRAERHSHSNLLGALPD